MNKFHRKLLILLSGVFFSLGCSSNKNGENKDQLIYEPLSSTSTSLLEGNFQVDEEFIKVGREEVKFKMGACEEGRTSVSVSGVELEISGVFKVFAYADASLVQGFEVDFTPILISRFPEEHKIKMRVKHLGKRTSTTTAIEEHSMYRPILDYKAHSRNYLPNKKISIILEFHNDLENRKASVSMFDPLLLRSDDQRQPAQFFSNIRTVRTVRTVRAGGENLPEPEQEERSFFTQASGTHCGFSLRNAKMENTPESVKIGPPIRPKDI